MATTQNISMTDELASFVSKQVESGDFASVSEVYREALRGFRDKVEAQRSYKDLVSSKIEASKKAYENGEYFSLESAEIEEFMTNITEEICY